MGIRVTGLDAFDCRTTEVIVMRVGDNDGVDDRYIFDFTRDFCVSFWS